MKTRLIILLLLIVCFSCGTNNKPVSDAQKEKIKGEVKEVVNKFNKGCEEANPEMLFQLYLNTPDFIYMSNGKIFNYQESIDTTKLLFSSLLSQKGTIVSEKYVIPDNTTVLFTENTKWLMNFKDGHSVMQDPWIMQLLLKKIDGKWRIISGVESGVEKPVASEPSKELNQVELMKQWIGTWKCDIAKDTTAVWVETSYGTGLEGIYKYATKGKFFLEGKEFAGYDKRFDKYIAAQMVRGKDIEIYAVWFTSKYKCILLPFSDISNTESASFRTESTFTSSDIEVDTTFVNNKPVKTETWTRVK
jgi:hypothetical protein